MLFDFNFTPDPANPPKLEGPFWDFYYRELEKVSKKADNDAGVKLSDSPYYQEFLSALRGDLPRECEYPKRLEDKLKRFKSQKDADNFMTDLSEQIGCKWGPIIGRFIDWVLEKSHYPNNINVLLRDGECIKRVFNLQSFKQHLKTTTSLNELCYNDSLLHFESKAIEYGIKAGLATENTLVDSGMKGTIISWLHGIHAPFRSEMLMFFSINPYIESFLTDCRVMLDFYKQTFGNKKESQELREISPLCSYENFCLALLRMFECFPKSYKKPRYYEKTERGIQPVLRPSDDETLKLRDHFYQGVKAS